nr:syntaxin 5 [Ipomoea batatas]
MILNDSICSTGNPRPKVSTFFPNRSNKNVTFHFTLRIHHRRKYTFEIHINAILSAPRLALTDDDGRHDLLPEIGFPLLHGSHDHVTNASRRQPVEATLDPLH